MPPLARKRRCKCRLILGIVCALGILLVGLIGLQALFPLGFREQILGWSASHDLEPAWVASVIRNESRFQPDDMSPVGAIGLMQIMPETGAWIAEQLGLSDYSLAHLTDPALNIQLGTWYLRYLLDRFHTPDEALMAYNAGPTNAERWDGNLELAFPETQQYIRRIHLSLPVYRVYFAAPWLVNLLHFLDF
ncbi:lytic transglycosylase domain-containing protein [Candidatus Bipolaricaulota bacterium]|nr:lytic transglycosylase domain-containing protein [Candidatus Bipolaricaulota bacterium]